MYIDVVVCTVNIVIEKINIHKNCTLTAQFYTLLSYLSITWTVGTYVAIRITFKYVCRIQGCREQLLIGQADLHWSSKFILCYIPIV